MSKICTLKEAEWSIKYHYWRKKYSFEEFKDFARNNVGLLIEYLREDENIAIEFDTLAFDYRSGEVDTDKYKTLEDYLSTWVLWYVNEFIKAIESHLNGSTLSIYRTLALKAYTQLDTDDLGICWTWDKDNLKNLERILFTDKSYDYRIRMSGTTTIDNIDWMESFILYKDFYDEEREVRIIDPKGIKLKSYTVLDSNNRIIKQNGD